MKKNITLIFLCIFSVCTIHAEITWNLSDDGTLTISGTNMPDYFDNAPWSYRRDDINNVVIREGVTNISSYAFSDCWALNSIYIPNTVTSIGENAFHFCSALQSIAIPKSVKTIGKEAFNYCSSLTSIIVEEGNGTYDSRGNCNAIIETRSNTLVKGCRTTVVPNSIINIGNNAFEGCTGLTSISVPNSVTNIGKEAFFNCSDLLSIIFPNSLTSIGYFAFGYCQNITSVIIPKYVTSIDGTAFSGCSGLTSIAVENGNATYDSRNNCNAIIYTNNNTIVVGCKNTIIPNSVTSIGDYAFANCSNLKSISIPNSVISIGTQAFFNCGFTSIIIPNSVTSIGVGAFYDCVFLKSITIPNSVTEIGESAFASTKWYDNQPNGLVYINSILYKYKGTMPANSSVIIKEGTTKIVDNTFCGCSGLTSVGIPNSVTSIGYGAFSGCTGLASITIPNSVTSIGGSAFSGCANLISINIPNSITTIGEGAFSGCSSLSSIVIPNTITSIGNYAFSGCSGITSIRIPASVTSIGENAFGGCSGLKKATIEVNQDLDVKSYVFRGSGLDELILIGKTLPKSANDNIAYGLYEKTVLYVPSSLYKKYCSTSPWSKFTNIVEIPDESISLTDMEIFAVIAKISTIGKVEYTDACKSKIDAASTAYNALTDAQKAQVSNLDILTKAQQAYETLKAAAEKLAADKAAANKVVNKIKAIGTVEYTDACKEKIDAASKAYEALTDDQKAFVTNIDVLTKAQQTYETLKAATEKLAADKAAANKVVNKIKAIGTVEYTDACKEKIDAASKAYEALTDDQKALVTNLNVLTKAKKTYDNLKAAAEKLAADKAAADPVIAKINAIGKVEYTYACKDKIDEANNAYNSLTADQKALVTNIDVLTTAKQTYDNLKTAADKLAADKAAADPVIAKINAIGKVEYTYACKDKIDEANNAYNALTADQKALVTNLDILTTSKQTYDNLKAAADKLAADKAAFENYKSELKAIIESLCKDDDSDAIKEIINKAISDINALGYEEAISLDDNKAKINSFVTSVNEAVEKQRAEDQKTNGIDELELAEKVNIYDLNGRKLTNSMLKSGLYIKNGKKVVVK